MQVYINLKLVNAENNNSIVGKGRNSVKNNKFIYLK